jgi:hypothetical protein
MACLLAVRDDGVSLACSTGEDDHKLSRGRN